MRPRGGEASAGCGRARSRSAFSQEAFDGVAVRPIAGAASRTNARHGAMEACTSDAMAGA